MKKKTKNVIVLLKGTCVRTPWIEIKSLALTAQSQWISINEGEKKENHLFNILIKISLRLSIRWSEWMCSYFFNISCMTNKALI